MEGDLGEFACSFDVPGVELPTYCVTALVLNSGQCYNDAINAEKSWL
jgi:hypothetical protein